MHARACFHQQTVRKQSVLKQSTVENNAKVASYGRFDLIFGTGLKFPAKPTPVELHSSHGDPFRDQKSF